MNTHNWFEGKVKYVKTCDDGKEKKVSETYLVDAISYTEAEARIFSEMEHIISGPFILSSLKKSNIVEIVASGDENDDRWYKGKVAILDADELTGKEKRTNQYALVAAKDIQVALANLEESMSTYIIPYEISSISDTNIFDVYPYFENEEEQTEKEREDCE